MSLAGIVAEFNPLHNGHKYLIDCAKNDGHNVACVISGNFVQRGDTAIIPKFKRAETALIAGADIVVELPVPWSMSTAQNFAFGAISQLSALNIDILYFGSESGNEDLLQSVAEILESNAYNEIIKNELNNGVTFAKLRQKAVESLLGEEAALALENPNDTLAVEYIGAAKKLGLNIKFKAIKRIGANHNDASSKDNYSTSTLLRNEIKNSNTNYLKEFIPKNILSVVQSSPKSDIQKLDSAIISKLKLTDYETISKLPDLSEGLENLLYKKIKEADSYSKLCDLVKTKRYTMARVRRIILSAFLGIDNSWFLKEPPYVRILGFSSDGQTLIPKIVKKPIITRISQINRLDETSKAVLELENKISSVYALTLDNPKKMIDENSEKLLRI